MSERIAGMNKRNDTTFKHTVRDLTPEQTAMGVKVIAGATMITTAPFAGLVSGAASGLMGLDTVRAGMTNTNTVVYGTAVAAGATPGQAVALEVLASAPGAAVAGPKALLSGSRNIVRGAVVFSEAEAAAAAQAGKAVAKEIAEHPGQAAAAAEQALAATELEAAAGGPGAGAGSSEIHHIMTNKNNLSTAAGGPYTPKFEALAQQRGITLEDAMNKMSLPGHQGPHPAYNAAVYDKLVAATKGLKGQAFNQAFDAEMAATRAETATPGSPLNKLATGQ